MTATKLATRKPSGLPSWPMVLIAGAEKAGKSWACAVASGSDLVGRTLWVGVGEDDPDEYGAVPGADFDIVLHDGTWRGILAAVDAAVAEPPTGGKPNLIVVDSMTRVWDLLCDMAQDTANSRAARKASKENRGSGGGDAEIPISMDLWNVAKDRWGQLLAELRSHRGPVLLTARLDEVTVMENGKPTQGKTLKIKAEKSLPYDVGAIVQMPERGSAYLMGVRSARIQLPRPRPWPGFTVDALWRELGLHETEAWGRVHADVRRADAEGDAATAPAVQGMAVEQRAALDEAVNRVLAATDVDALRATWQALPKPALDEPVTVDTDVVALLHLDVPVTLGALLTATAKYVGEHGLSVDQALVLADTDPTPEPAADAAPAAA